MMSDQPPRVLSGLEIPEDLRAIPDPCLRLFVRGTLPEGGAPRVAVVGSRTPSWSGRRTAHAIAFGLARAGVVVVSGLARGIDAAAHEGALDAGGVTLAFLGTGVDVLYPRSCRRLAERIPDRGALISEYEPGSPPLPYHFVLRNRLVAAYTKGVLVVEAGPQSGALITAGKALELGREVWAVPGDPDRLTTKGSNRLLRDGAGCVLDAEDLLVALGLTRRGGEPGEELIPPGLTESEERAWRAIRDEGTANVECLARTTGLPVAALLEALSLLELTGHVSRDGSAFRLCRRQ
jgi:DNA processing protein